MPKYPVTDRQTGDTWIIDAETPERAREIASLRRAARQGTIKDRMVPQVEEPGLYGFLKESISAPYEGPPEKLPGFGASFARTYKEGVTALGRELLPPFMRGEEPEKFDPVKRFGEAGGDVLKVVGMAPPVAAMLAAQDQIGKTARSYGASPLTAGLLSQLGAFLYPAAEKRLAARSARKAGEFEAKKAAAETERQAETLRGAESLRKTREAIAGAKQAEEAGKELPARPVKQLQLSREELRKAEAAEKETDLSQAANILTAEQTAEREKKAAKEFADMTAAEHEQALADLRQLPQISQEVFQAGRKRIANSEMGRIQFGEEFKGPEFQPRGAPREGFYPQAEELRRGEVDKLYAEARKAGEGATIPAEKILDPLLADLKSQGIAVEAMPTTAERTGHRVAEAVEPEIANLQVEQEAFKAAEEHLTSEQYQYLKYGKGSTPGTPGSNVPAIPKSIVEAIVNAMNKTKRGVGVPGREMEAILEKAAPRQAGVSVNDAMVLHQRFNGAIRAAERAKDWALTRQLRGYKDIVDRAINEVKPEALIKLGEADLFNASQYSPFFDPRSKLYKISQSQAANVVDTLVSKTDVKTTRQAMSVLSDEGKDALRGAWIQRVFEKSLDDFKGTFSPEKLAKEWNSYQPEVKQALLGDSAKEMDDIIKGMGKRTRELQDIAETKKLRAGMAAERPAIVGAEQAAQIKMTKEAAEAAGEKAAARTKAAKAETGIAYGALERRVKEQEARSDFVKELEKNYKLASEKLARDTVEFANKEAELRAPRGLHQILGMSNLHVQMALGLLDIAEWMGGAGGRRYLVFAARHAFVYYLAKNPEMLGIMARYGKNGMNIVSRVINGDPLSATYVRDARAAWLLAEQAELLKAREQRDATAGTPNQKSGRR